MLVDIARLSEDRELALRETWDPADKDLNAPGMDFDGPLEVAAFLKRDSGLVKARIALSGRVTFTCGRCLAVFGQPWGREFTLAYPLDEVDRSFEIDADIREEMILNYPVIILCGEGCRGLCLRCGVNLNKEKCLCKS